MRGFIIALAAIIIFYPASIKADETLPLDTSGTAAVEEPGLPVISNEPEMPDVQEGLNGTEPALPSQPSARSDTGTTQATQSIQASGESAADMVSGTPSALTKSAALKSSDKPQKSTDEGKKLFASGKALYKAGKFEEAIVNLQKALSVYTKSTAPRQLTDLISSCNSKIKKKQMQIDSLNQAADKSYAAGEYKKAMGNWQKIITIDPSNTDAAAKILKAAADLKTACDTLKAASQSSLADGNVVDAADKVRRLKALDPSNHEGDDLLKYMEPQIKAASKKLEIEAIEDYTSKKYNEAIAVWQKMLILNPADTELSGKIEKTREKLKNIDSMTNNR
ncbi:MAG: hypothetical protein ABSA34_03505 [Candidatus Goldiibacteriota bacterium]|jgi:tetratricopeptide (TPR) repeat protein